MASRAIKKFATDLDVVVTNLKEKRTMSSKLREAVESLLDLLDDEAITEEILLIARENRCHRESLHIDKKLEVLRKAKAALAAPPRNCDLYKSEPEAYQAYLTAMKNATRKTYVYFEPWLFAEAKGEAK
jgi:DNA invertase Pin-like site-specific DNA recombinase